MRLNLLLRALYKGYSWENIRFLYRQWNNESAYGSSRLFRENNNPFGMSAVYTRPTTQEGFVNLPDGNTNGVYPSVASAVKDRLLWDQFFRMDPTSLLYPYEVSKKFNPSPKYFETVSNTPDKGLRTDLILLLLPFPLLVVVFLLFNL